MLKTIIAKLLGDLKVAQNKIIKAEKKVVNALAVFDKAASDVEKANTELEKAVENAEKYTEKLKAEIAKTTDTKNKAVNSLSQNNALLTKLNEFRISK